MRSEGIGAKLEGGVRVPMSGAGSQKGDIKTARFRIEDKFTDAHSYTITLAIWEKIVAEAMQTPPGLLPQMRVTLPGHTLRIMREEDYLALIAELPIFSNISPMPEEGLHDN